MILDASFGGSIVFKISNEAITIIEALASVDLCNQHGRIQTLQQQTLELKSQKIIVAQHKFLAQQIETLHQQNG